MICCTIIIEYAIIILPVLTIVYKDCLWFIANAMALFQCHNPLNFTGFKALIFFVQINGTICL